MPSPSRREPFVPTTSELTIATEFGIPLTGRGGIQERLEQAAALDAQQTEEFRNQPIIRVRHAGARARAHFDAWQVESGLQVVDMRLSDGREGPDTPEALADFVPLARIATYEAADGTRPDPARIAPEPTADSPVPTSDVSAFHVVGMRRNGEIAVYATWSHDPEMGMGETVFEEEETISAAALDRISFASDAGVIQGAPAVADHIEQKIDAGIGRVMKQKPRGRSR